MTIFSKEGVRDVSKVTVYAYEYKLPKKDSKGYNLYEVDCHEKEAEGYYDELAQEAKSKVSFKDADLLSFEVDKLIKDKPNKSVKTDIKITNKSKAEISECDFEVAYFDKEGNVLCDDSMYVDVFISPGKDVIETTYGEKEVLDVSKAEVYAYTYTLVDPDKHGNRIYKVSVLTKEIVVLE